MDEPSGLPTYSDDDTITAAYCFAVILAGISICFGVAIFIYGIGSTICCLCLPGIYFDDTQDMTHFSNLVYFLTPEERHSIIIQAFENLSFLYNMEDKKDKETSKKDITHKEGSESSSEASVCIVFCHDHDKSIVGAPKSKENSGDNNNNNNNDDDEDNSNSQLDDICETITQSNNYNGDKGDNEDENAGDVESGQQNGEFVLGMEKAKDENKEVYDDDDDDEQEQCIICLAEFETGDKVMSGSSFCRHLYHYDCLRQWLERQDHCPQCREHVLSPEAFDRAARATLTAERITEVERISIDSWIDCEI